MRDADVMVSFAKEASAQMSVEMPNVDESLLRCLSATSGGCFAPLSAFLGGTVAQEALKALTGKFTPCRQWVSLYLLIFCNYSALLKLI